MELTLQHLRLLREVAHRKTIAAAATSLGYTASAVSQQLTRLERSTGVPVLERVGRGVRLTDAGRELVDHADALLAGMEAAQASLERVSADVRGVLDIGTYESVANAMLPRLLRELRIRYPDLTLRAREADPDAAADLVAGGELDLAFDIEYPHNPAPLRDDLVRTVVLTDRFHLVAAVDHPTFGTATGPVPLSALAGIDMITPDLATGCGRHIAIACRDAGFEPHVVHHFDDYPTTLQLARAGHGVALVSDLGLATGQPGLNVLELSEPLSRVIALISRRASEGRPAIRVIVDEVERVASGLSTPPAGAVR